MAITIQCSGSGSDYKSAGTVYTDAPLPIADVAVGDWMLIALAADADVVPSSIVLEDSVTHYLSYQYTFSTVSTATNAGNVVTAIIIAKVPSFPGVNDFYLVANGLNSGEAKAMSVYVVRGLDATTPFDKSASATGSGTLHSTGTTATLSQSDEIFIAAIGSEHKLSELAGTWTTGGSYVSGNELSDGTEANGSAANITIRSAAEIVSSTDGLSGRITSEDSCDWAACIASFKAAPPEPFPPVPGRVHRDARNVLLRM